MEKNSIATRAQWIELVGGESKAIAQEEAALSIGREFLPPLVQAVIAGAAPEPAYWQWLAEQYVASESEEGETRSEPAHAIEIGSVTEEFVGDEEPSEYCAYIAVEVTIDDETVSVGTMVGARESDHAQIRNARCGVRPYLTTWFADASDYDHVPLGLRDQVGGALYAARARLWQEAQKLRGDA